MNNTIELKVNDRVIALNPFVKKIISNILLGAVRSLDKIPQSWKKIEITLQTEPEIGGRSNPMKYLKTFAKKCNGCNICMSVCSQLYFKVDDPIKSAIQVFPTGQNAFTLSVCNQCRVCVDECPTQAITVNKQGVVMINKTLCINCLACVAACPTSTMMTFKGGLIPFKCIACDACAKQCPTGALKIETKED